MTNEKFIEITDKENTKLVIPVSRCALVNGPSIPAGVLVLGEPKGRMVFSVSQEEHDRLRSLLMPTPMGFEH